MGNLEETIIFDQYSRYRRLSEIIDFFSIGTNSKILDIGSGLPCLLGKFLPEYPITFLDPQFDKLSAPYSEKISGDIWSPSLNNKKFNYVVCSDTFEHIPQKSRPDFLARLIDLAESGVFLGCPFEDAGEGESTDIYVNDFYKLFLGKDFNWLEEHFSNGLPSMTQTLDFFKNKGWHCQVFPNGYTPWMKKLLSYTLTLHDIQPEKLPHLLELSAYFNHYLYQYDNREPAYRYFIVATREKHSMQKPYMAQLNHESKKHWQWIENKMHSEVARLILRKPENRIDLNRIISAKCLEQMDSNWYSETPDAPKSIHQGELSVKKDQLLCREFTLPTNATHVQVNGELSLKSGKKKLALGAQLNWEKHDGSFLSYGILNVNMALDGATVSGYLPRPENASRFCLKIVAPKEGTTYLLKDFQIAFMKD
jgi:hypothetical protein